MGTVLRKELERSQFEVHGLDLRGEGQELGDVLKIQDVRRAIQSCDGVVHLAAVSRVIWGEKDPDFCWQTNVEGISNVLKAVEEQENTPWLIFASSREVYGQPPTLPATEDTCLNPVNIYGQSKLAGEQLVRSASDHGVRAAVVRLSNVYGRIYDHPDRVVPAFAKAAIENRQLRIDGRNHVFDFTHVEDTARGICALAKYLDDGKPAPAAIHFLTGFPTTLEDLAKLSIELAGSTSELTEAAPRSYDVSQFYGCNQRAKEVLNWKPSILLREGLSQLIRDFELNAQLNG